MGKSMRTGTTPWIRARVEAADGSGAAIERIGPLTPYLTQTIVEDALSAGRGSTVVLDVRWDSPRQLLDALRRRVELLTNRGIQVMVRSGEDGPGRPLGRSAA